MSFFPTDAESAAATAFLERAGAGELRHGDRTLLDHLVGTWCILDAWRRPRHVTLAGLFHSVYGTRSFRSRLLPLSARPQVARIIGQRAERLVFEFSKFDASRASTLSAAIRGELVEIALANCIEQTPVSEMLALSHYAPYASELSQPVREAYRRELERRWAAQ